MTAVAGWRMGREAGRRPQVRGAHSRLSSSTPDRWGLEKDEPGGRKAGLCTTRRDDRHPATHALSGRLPSRSLGSRFVGSCRSRVHTSTLLERCSRDTSRALAPRVGRGCNAHLGRCGRSPARAGATTLVTQQCAWENRLTFTRVVRESLPDRAAGADVLNATRSAIFAVVTKWAPIRD